MLYLFSPCADTFIGLTVFIDFVEWETHEFTVHDSGRRIECITGSVYCSTLDDVTAALRRLAQPGDLILTVGAGDIYTAGEQLLHGTH